MTQPYGQQPGSHGQQPGGYPQTPPGGYQQPGGYPQSPPGGFQQPAYPQAPGYAAGAGGLPQAPPDYGQAANSGVRPGTVTAAAVLAYVQGGITLITTILGIAGASQADASTEGAAITWALLLAQVAGVILLIFGGVMITQGKNRVLLIIGCAVELVICAIYLIAFAIIPTFGESTLEGAKAVLIASALFFAVMPTISLILSLGSAASTFLRARRGY